MKSMRNAITRWLGDKALDELLSAEELARIEDVEPSDIFIVGYPKSGNTWFQNLVAGAAFGVMPEYAPPSLIQGDLIPGIHRKRFYKRYASPMFFKSHHLPQQQYRRVVYLLRDGRDVMVSYFRMLQARGTAVEFMEMVRAGQHLFPGKWHEHVRSWLENPFQAEMLVIKYEDLHADPVRELRRFCVFAGIDRSEALLKAVCESAAFSKLQEREQRMGRTYKDPNWKPEKLFFRRGVVGSHQDEMPKEVLEVFMQESAETLKAAGYSV